MKFKMTVAVKRYAVEKLGCSLDSTDVQIIDACARAIADKTLTRKELARLCGTEESAEQRIASEVQRQVTEALKGAGLLGKKTKKETKKEAPPASPDQTAIDQAVDKKLAALGITGASPSEVFGKSSNYLKEDHVRLKGVEEQFDRTRKSAVCPSHTALGSKHAFAGQPASHMGRPLDHPSDLDKAVIGAYFKFAITKGGSVQDVPRRLKMTDTDRELVQYAMHKMSWTGVLSRSDPDGEDIGGTPLNRVRLTDFQRKGLLDDTASGGLEAAPVIFDDAVILTPVLYGELYPLVNVIPINSGRRIHGFSMGNPTFTSGTPEGTAITPFDTASFIAAFDTAIYNAVGAMEIGLDFEEDAPNDIGGIVVERYGLKAMEYLDRVIAMGDGVTEPLGIFLATGTTAVNSDNNLAGPPTVSDYEGLAFGLPKQFRREAGARLAFVGNDVSYRRARGIPVGPADERRVFGMDEQDYKLFGVDYKIQNNIPNNWVGYANFRRYRMYRRLGLNVRIETAGNYLATRNLRVVVLRMRYGGQPELGQAFAISQDFQA